MTTPEAGIFESGPRHKMSNATDERVLQDFSTGAKVSREFENSSFYLWILDKCNNYFQRYNLISGSPANGIDALIMDTTHLLSTALIWLAHGHL